MSKAYTESRGEKLKKKGRKGLFRLLFSRTGLVAVVLLLNIALLVALVLRFRDYMVEYVSAATVLSVVLMMLLISSRANASVKVTWLVVFTVLPVFGLVLYVYTQSDLGHRALRDRIHELMDKTRSKLPQTDAASKLQKTDAGAAGLGRYLWRCGFPTYENCDVTYYTSGEEKFAAMLEELEKAREFIFLEYFIVEEGEMWNAVLEVLERKAREGVDVRVLYDDFGCIQTLPGNYYKQLRRWGIEARVFNPFLPVLSGRLNNRNHRKLMIIDGKVGFTGGINLADEYINRKERFGHWKDCAVCLQGEGVWAMTVMFLAMWDSQSGEQEDIASFRPEYAYRLAGGEGFVHPFSDTPLDQEDVAERLLLSMFHKACRSIYIMTPYLILDDQMTDALLTAAKSGIDVRIITPHIPDKWYVHAVTRAYYELLTENGVRIYEYTPGFIHSKVYLVDDRLAMTGSVNLDFRSLYLHFENAVYMFDTACNAAIAEDFQNTFPLCEEITWRKSRNTNLLQRLLQTALRFLSPLM